MIYGVYIKNKPKGKWQLLSLAASAEVAHADLANATEQAKKQAFLEGTDVPEVGLHIFESSFYIPQTMDKIKKQNIILN